MPRFKTIGAPPAFKKGVKALGGRNRHNPWPQPQPRKPPKDATPKTQ